MQTEEDRFSQCQFDAVFEAGEKKIAAWMVEMADSARMSEGGILFNRC